MGWEGNFKNGRNHCHLTRNFCRRQTKENRTTEEYQVETYLFS